LLLIYNLLDICILNQRISIDLCSTVYKQNHNNKGSSINLKQKQNNANTNKWPYSKSKLE